MPKNSSSSPIELMLVQNDFRQGSYLRKQTTRAMTKSVESVAAAFVAVMRSCDRNMDSITTVLQEGTRHIERDNLGSFMESLARKIETLVGSLKNNADNVNFFNVHFIERVKNEYRAHCVLLQLV